MTPLAQQIVNDYTRSLKERTFKDQSGLLPRLLTSHCFEVTDVFDAAGDLAADLHRRGMSLRGTRSFLPAPLTWIEWAHKNEAGVITGRQGVLLEAEDGADRASSTWATNMDGLFLSARRRGGLFLAGDGSLEQEYLSVHDFPGEPEEEARGWVSLIYSLLALINTPRIIGRRQHLPHAGLQRKLAAMKGLPGKYPLHAWQEILLEVTPTHDARGEQQHEARLTGGKALHFVRAHLRVNHRTLGGGELEFFNVSSYWRGTGKLGIRRARYILKRPRRPSGDDPLVNI